MVSLSPPPCESDLAGGDFVVRREQPSKRKGSFWDPSRLARCLFPQAAVGVGGQNTSNEDNADVATAPAPTRPCRDADSEDVKIQGFGGWNGRSLDVGAVEQSSVPAGAWPSTPPGVPKKPLSQEFAEADAAAEAALAEVAQLDRPASWRPATGKSNSDEQKRLTTPPPPPLSRPPSSKVVSSAVGASVPPLPPALTWTPGNSPPLLPPELAGSKLIEAATEPSAMSHGEAPPPPPLALCDSQRSSSSMKRAVPRGPLAQDPSRSLPRALSKTTPPPLPQWSSSFVESAGIQEFLQAREAEPLPMELLEEEDEEESKETPATPAPRLSDYRSKQSDPDLSSILKDTKSVLRPAQSYRMLGSLQNRQLSKAKPSARGASAASSRPTTAGDEGSGEESMASVATATGAPGLRAWREEWTPGNEPAVPPPPPLLSAERLEIATTAALPRFQASSCSSSTSKRPPLAPSNPNKDSEFPEARQVGSSEENFEAALRRLAESRAAGAAMPPAQSRSSERWSGGGSRAGSRPGSAQAGLPRRDSRPTSAQERHRPPAAGVRWSTEATEGTEADDEHESSVVKVVGSTTMRRQFSELALAFTTIDAVA
mmetsp:Transcript_68222/g.142575  ORF Transcript_68222/g.142575 Transcript_68222/m.142575 type:complete len:600 (-) Transcript_68222:99-1898(-)